jgi:tripartite-type tricarboxylate transporter receptor subunit TctC
LKILHALVLAAALVSGLATSHTHAQSTAFPNRPIKLIVGWSPGGATDILARQVSTEMSRQLGQPVVVDNRPGAVGTIGHAEVAKAAPDGYVLVLATNSTYAIAPHLIKTLPYKPDALTPVSLLAVSPLILTVKPASTARGVADLLEASRKTPGSLNFSSGGNGSTSHLASELFMDLTKTSMTHIPYKGGGPATMAIAMGEVDLGFVDMGVAIPLITAGRLKAVAVTGTTRSALLPDVPTVGESGVPQFDATTKFALFAPAGTPKPVIDRLHEAVRVVMAGADLRSKLGSQGVDIVASTPDELRKDMTEASARWGRVIGARHVTLD